MTQNNNLSSIQQYTLNRVDNLEEFMRLHAESTAASIASLSSSEKHIHETIENLVNNVITPMVNEQKENKTRIQAIASKVKLHSILITVTIGSAGTVVGWITTTDAFRGALNKVILNLFHI